MAPNLWGAKGKNSLAVFLEPNDDGDDEDGAGAYFPRSVRGCAMALHQDNDGLQPLLHESPVSVINPAPDSPARPKADGP